MINIDGLTCEQVVIADLLWHADSPEDMNKIIAVFGSLKIEPIMEMIRLAVIDSFAETDVSDAAAYLSKY